MIEVEGQPLHTPYADVLRVRARHLQLSKWDGSRFQEEVAQLQALPRVEPSSFVAAGDRSLVHLNSLLHPTSRSEKLAAAARSTRSP